MISSEGRCDVSRHDSVGLKRAGFRERRGKMNRLGRDVGERVKSEEAGESAFAWRDRFSGAVGLTLYGLSR